MDTRLGQHHSPPLSLGITTSKLFSSPVPYAEKHLIRNLCGTDFMHAETVKQRPKCFAE